MYGFCGADYSEAYAPASFHRVTKNGLMHIVPSPFNTGKGNPNDASTSSAGEAAMRNFFKVFYDSGCDRKYKNSADYLLSMFAGVMHTLFPMHIPFWITSHDDG